MNASETANFIYEYLEDLLFNLSYNDFNELFVYEKLVTEKERINYLCFDFENNEKNTYLDEDEMKDLETELSAMVGDNTRMEAITSEMLNAMCNFYKDRR